VSDRQPLILVVDDNEDNRFTLTQRLRREGYTEVIEAEDGHKTLQLLAERRFDLVLLDIMMPGIDGYQVLEHIKSDMSLRDIPVIMISAIEDMDSVVRCIRIGPRTICRSRSTPCCSRRGSAPASSRSGCATK
jgi:adenylate cyclase